MAAAEHDYEEFQDPACLRQHLQEVHHAMSPGEFHGNTVMHKADHQVADRRAAADYEHVRIGGHGATGVTLRRCTRCRALLVPGFTEEKAHDAWHAGLVLKETPGW